MVLIFILSPLLSSKSYKEEKKESRLFFFSHWMGFLKVLLDKFGFFLFDEVWGFLSVEKLTRLKVEKHLNTFCCEHIFSNS